MLLTPDGGFNRGSVVGIWGNVSLHPGTWSRVLDVLVLWTCCVDDVRPSGHTGRTPGGDTSFHDSHDFEARCCECVCYSLQTTLALAPAMVRERHDARPTPFDELAATRERYARQRTATKSRFSTFRCYERKISRRERETAHTAHTQNLVASLTKHT